MHNTDLNNTIDRIVAVGNCCGCGTCEAACPTGAIKVMLDSRTGQYAPSIDMSNCTDCGLCLRVCPGSEVLIDDLARQNIDVGKKNRKLGMYREILLGHATDEQVRYNGSSGGMVTALLIFAMERKMIDGAVVVGYEVGNPLQSRPFVARTREDILAAAGSKYCPAPTNIVLRYIRDTPGAYAVVVLPCQAHAIRKWQALDPIMNERIKYVFGLFCANETTYLGTQFFLWCHRIPLSSVRRISYRAGGWPGNIEIETTTRTYCFKRATHESSVWKRVKLSSAFHYDFMMPRCTVCPDLACELADASFADPHLQEMREKHRVGISWCIVRTSKMAALINAAVEAGHLGIEKFEEEHALRAQNYAFKDGVADRMRYWEQLGRVLPYFGRTYIIPSCVCRTARAYRWSFVSYKRGIWPVIWLWIFLVRLPSSYISIQTSRIRRRCVYLAQRIRVFSSVKSAKDGLS